MRIKIWLAAQLAVATIMLPLLVLIAERAVAQTSGCTTTATVKCLYQGSSSAGKDCGSCTCQGTGFNGQCHWSGHYQAGCTCGSVRTYCHTCNTPSGGGGSGGDPIPE